MLKTCSHRNRISQERLWKLPSRKSQEPRGLIRKKRSGSGHSTSKSTSDGIDFSNDKPWVRGEKQTLVGQPRGAAPESHPKKAKVLKEH